MLVEEVGQAKWGGVWVDAARLQVRTSICAACEPTPPSPTTMMKASLILAKDSSPKKDITRAKSSLSTSGGRQVEPSETAALTLTLGSEDRGLEAGLCVDRAERQGPC